MKYTFVAALLLFIIQMSSASSSSSDRGTESPSDSTDSPEMTTTEITSTEMTTTEMTTTEMTTTEGPTTTEILATVLADDGTGRLKNCGTTTTCANSVIVLADAKVLDCVPDDSCRNSDAIFDVMAGKDFAMKCRGEDSCRSDDEDNEFVINCGAAGASVEKIKCTGERSCKGLTIELNDCVVAEVDCEDDGCDDATFILDGSSITEFICQNGGCSRCRIEGDITDDCADGSFIPALVNDKRGSEPSLQTEQLTNVKYSMISVAVIIAVVAIVIAAVIYTRRRQERGSKVPMEDENEMADMKTTELVGEDEENLID